MNSHRSPAEAISIPLADQSYTKTCCLGKESQGFPNSCTMSDLIPFTLPCEGLYIDLYRKYFSTDKGACTNLCFHNSLL